MIKRVQRAFRAVGAALGDACLIAIMLVALVCMSVLERDAARAAAKREGR